MQKFIKKLHKEYPESLSNPLIDKDLKIMIKQFLLNKLPLPENNFWEVYFQHDGFAFNGLEIFSVSPKALVEEGYTLPNLFEENLNFHKYYIGYNDYSPNYFLIGRSDEDILVFDIKNNFFAALACEDLMVYEKFSLLDELLDSYNRI
ncbi:MAG: YrhA family protein [Bacteroidales bacterium]|nr:YrhA family protein [Bacteroidales bacterium]